MTNLTTVKYGKDFAKEIRLPSDMVKDIQSKHSAMLRAEKQYNTKNEVLKEAMMVLVAYCAENNISRATGGTILAGIAGIEFLKHDRTLANAWQFVAKELLTDKEMKEQSARAELPEAERKALEAKEREAEAKKAEEVARAEAIATINKDGLAVALALQDNNIRALGGLLLDTLTADQVDVLAKQLNDAIAGRRTIREHKQLSLKAS